MGWLVLLVARSRVVLLVVWFTSFFFFGGGIRGAKVLRSQFSFCFSFVFLPSRFCYTLAFFFNFP